MEPHIQSRAAFALLQKELKAESMPEWQCKAIFRKNFIEAAKEKGTLRCAYCGAFPLKDERKGVKKQLQATIDHVVPVCMTKNYYDKSNIVICCSVCNNSKGSLLLEQWTERPIFKPEKENSKQKRKERRKGLLNEKAAG